MKTCLPIVLFALISTSGFARSPKRQDPRSEPPTGSIAGTVAIDGTPAPQITVVLLLDNHDLPIVARTTTNEAGHFKLANLPSGRYLATVIAPTWSSGVTTNPDSEGKPVSLKDGQELEDVVRARPPLIEEAALVFTRDDQPPGLPHFEPPYSFSSAVAVNRKGEFAIPKLEPGTYRLRPDLR